jgi:hypothetical protein
MSENPFIRDYNPSEQAFSSEGYTDVTVLLDRSSSMMKLRQTVIDSFNSQFAKMRENKGDTRWTFCQFDDKDSAKGAKEAFPHTVFEHRAEKDMTPLTLNDFKPRGSTALVDAVCMTMQQIDARVSGREDSIKPVLMIVTDGLENSSVEFSSAKMREMNAERQKKGWEVLYLGANQDAWSEAGKYGMAANTVGTYHYAGESVASGAVELTGSSNAYRFAATKEGLSSAIMSGMAGCGHIASGTHYARSSKNA